MKQWMHNREFLRTIHAGYPDWAVTAIFYTGLHAVDTLFAHLKIHGITSHRERNDVLLRTNRFSRIWSAYHPLYNLSRTIRYMARPQDWVPWQSLEREVIGRYLTPIETSVQNLTGEPLELPRIKLATITAESK